jgi:predicted dehydrogenase
MKRKRKINIGIIGCGHWGPNYIRTFSNIDDCNVKAICDLSRQHLARIKNRYPKIETTTDFKKIINDNEIDAVVITTPASIHYPLVKRALLKRRHILVEKPFVTKVKDAEELVELSKSVNKVFMVAHTFLYNSGIRSLKRYIQNKSMGRIYYLHSKRTNLGPLRQDVSSTWDLAPHDVSIFSFLLNSKPIEVIARGGIYLQKDKEDVSFSTLIYPNGIIANIHVSWLDPRKIREITVVGSKKMATFNDLELKNPICIYDKTVMKKRYKQDYSSYREFQMIIREKGEEIPRIKTQEPLWVQCRHFINCIYNNKKPLTDAESGLEVVKVLCAIEESIHGKGKVVKI